MAILELLLVALASPFMESPWLAICIFGPLCWLPLRTLSLKIRRKLRKRSNRSILRGGRYSREDNDQQTAILVRIMHTIVSMAQGTIRWIVSWRKPRLVFVEHSDGTVFSERFHYDKHEIAQQPLVPDINTPSPVSIPRKGIRRVDTPPPKKKRPARVTLEEEEKSSRRNLVVEEKENAAPVVRRENSTAGSTPYKSRESKGKFDTSNQEQPVYRYQRSPAPPTMALVVKEREPKKQVSFLHKPKDPNFLVPYSSTRVLPVQSYTSNRSTNPSPLKRKLQLPSSSTEEGPRRKRVALDRNKRRINLSRANRLYRQATTTPDHKRKEREEALVREFNRKRPKKEPKKAAAATTTAAAAASFQFGNTAPAPATDGKPSFQFGAAKAPEAPAADGKPAFQFGAKAADGAKAPAAPAAAPSTEVGGATKPAVQFGATKPAAVATAEAPKPAVQFGAGATATTPATAEAPKPAFQFGAAPAAATPGAAPTAEAPKPAISFGAGAPAAPAAPAPAAPAAKPAFSFGAGGAPAVAPTGAPAVSFGGAAPVAPAAAPTPAISFGAGAPAPTGAAAPTPGFSFGAAPAAAATAAPTPGFGFGTAPAPAGPGFSFAAPGAPTPPNVPGAAAQPNYPVNTMFPAGAPTPGRSASRRRVGRRGRRA